MNFLRDHMGGLPGGERAQRISAFVFDLFVTALSDTSDAMTV